MKKLLSSISDGRGFDIALVAFPLAFLFVMAGLPLLYNIVMSFQEVDMFSLGTFVRPFVGFKNYVDLFRQPEIWNWILSGDFGVLNFFLRESGLISGNIFWRSDANFSLWAVVIANIWLGTSFNMILLSVGLASIPGDLYEAAELDGANAWQRFYTITLPMMRSTIGAIISLGLIFTLQQFDLFAAITDGGPNNSSNVAQYWAWDLSFRQYDFGKGATISVIMIVFVMLASIVYVRSTRHEVRG